MVQLVNNQPAMQETRIQSLGQKDPLEKRQVTHSSILGLPGVSDGKKKKKKKKSTSNAGDLGSIPGLGRSSGEGNGKPLQYSGLENPMDKGA